MSKYILNFKVGVEVSKTISADSLEDALELAKEIARGDPVREGLIKIGARIDYQWNDDTIVSGVCKA